MQIKAYLGMRSNTDGQPAYGLPQTRKNWKSSRRKEENKMAKD